MSTLFITGYKEQPKMGPMPPSSYKSPTATRNLTLKGPSQPNASSKAKTTFQPNASLAVSLPRMGPMPPSNYQPKSAPVSLTVGPKVPPNMALNKSPNLDKSSSKTSEAVPNTGVKRFSQGSFGVGKEYDKYTKMYQKQIDEGITLEQSMYLSRTATQQDHINAFGNTDNWRKWGGGNKMGSAGAAVNAARRAQKARRDAQRNNTFSIPSLNSLMALNAGPSTPVKYDAHMNMFVPNMGGGRPNNIRPKGSASLKV